METQWKTSLMVRDLKKITEDFEMIIDGDTHTIQLKQRDENDGN